MAITLTEAAAKRAQTYIDKHEHGLGLRLGVRSSGCSGFAYVVKVADAIHADDQVFEDRGLKLVVDRKSLPFIDGTELDFVREGLNEAFRFSNPNVKSQCGCGESFAV